MENKNPYLNKKGDPDEISIATATATTKDGKTINYLAVSGKSWHGNAPNKVTINHKEYQVLIDGAYIIRADGKKLVSWVEPPFHPTFKIQPLILLGFVNSTQLTPYTHDND